MVPRVRQTRNYERFEWVSCCGNRSWSKHPHTHSTFTHLDASISLLSSVFLTHLHIHAHLHVHHIYPPVVTDTHTCCVESTMMHSYREVSKHTHAHINICFEGTGRKEHHLGREIQLVNPCVFILKMRAATFNLNTVLWWHRSHNDNFHPAKDYDIEIPCASSCWNCRHKMY